MLLRNLPIAALLCVERKDRDFFLFGQERLGLSELGFLGF
jgi:hypothetical protein